jgi:hypothetical protein
MVAPSIVLKRIQTAKNPLIPVKTTAVLIQSLLGSQSKTFQKFDMDFTLEFQNSTGFSF